MSHFTHEDGLREAHTNPTLFSLYQKGYIDEESFFKILTESRIGYEEEEEEEDKEVEIPVTPSTPVTPPTPPKVSKKARRGKVPGSSYKFHPFTEDDARDISAGYCHTRRQKIIDGVHHFHQCSRRATIRGGYCAGCHKTHETRTEKYAGAPGDMKISVDGDIRIVGGTPEQVVGIIRDDLHRGFIQFGICENGYAGPVKHLKPIPDEIMKLYNLPAKEKE